MPAMPGTAESELILRFPHAARRSASGSRSASECPAAVEAQALRVAIAVVVRGDEVLLVCRRGSDSLAWQFPAGAIEAGESPEQAAVRETLEETGLKVKAASLIGQRVHPKTGREMSYTACSVIGGEAHVADADELDAVAWVRLEEIPKYVPYGLFEPVQKYLDGTLTR